MACHATRSTLRHLRHVAAASPPITTPMSTATAAIDMQMHHVVTSRAMTTFSSSQQQKQLNNNNNNNINNGTPRNSRMLLYASAFALTAPLTTAVGLAEFSTMASTKSTSQQQQQQLSTISATEESTTTSKSATETTKELIDIVLYQYEVCPFCNKVRAYLDYHNIPYRVVEVDPLRKTELKQFSSDYRKVPIAVINSQQVNGSGSVISTVHELMMTSTSSSTTTTSHENESSSSSSSVTTPVEDKWLTWLDDHLIHLIAPNIYRTPAESLQTFNYITDKSKFSWWEKASIRYSGAAAMYLIGRRLKKKYNITDERKAMHNAINEWMMAIREGGSQFLDGKDKPGVADLSVFGVLKALRTFDLFQELRKENEEFSKWFDTMDELVGESSKTLEQ